MSDILEEPITLKMSMEIPDSLYQLLDIFSHSRDVFYVVGGAVRDTLMGKQPKDYDIATSMSPEEVVMRLAPYSKKAEVQGEASFAVARIIAYDGNEYEFAPFRIDRGTRFGGDAILSTEGRPLGIKDDVMRRDLTINALFYKIPTKAERASGESGEVVDYVGGVSDIENEVIRTVGDPEKRFEEDRLRILRAFRFAGRVGGKISPETANAIIKNNSLTEPSDAAVSDERVQDELKKGIRTSISPSNYINMLQEFGLLSQILPGLSTSRAISASKNICVQLATVLRGNDPRSVFETLMSKKFGTNIASGTKFLLLLDSLGPNNLVELKKEINRMRKTSGVAIDNNDIMDFGVVIGKDFSKFIDFSSAPPVISARELIAGGIKPGPGLGEALKEAEVSAYFSDLNIEEESGLSEETEDDLKALSSYLILKKLYKEAEAVSDIIKNASNNPDVYVPSMSGDVYVFDMDDTLFWAPDWHDAVSVSESGEALKSGNNLNMLFENVLNIVNDMNNSPELFLRRGKYGDMLPDLLEEFKSKIGRLSLVKQSFDMPILGKESQSVFVLVDKNNEPVSIVDFKYFFPSKHQKKFDTRGKYVDDIVIVSGDPSFYKNPMTLGWIPNNEILEIYKSSGNRVILTAREQGPGMSEGIEERLSAVGAPAPDAIFTRPAGASGGIYKGHVLGKIAEQESVTSVTFYDDNLRYVDQSKNILLSQYGEDAFNKVKINLVSVDSKPENIDINRPL